MAKSLSNIIRSGSTGTPLPVPFGGTGAVTLTGLVKGTGTAGLTAAVAGTDYQTPIGTISGIAKGNGTNLLTVATPGTDYLAPPTGTSLLKGNSGGALANAVAGTDYQTPIGTISGLVKGNGANALTAAVAGTDYLAGVAPGNSGNILTSSGGAWVSAPAPVTLPTQTGNSGKYLTTNGTTASWASAGGDVFKTYEILPNVAITDYAMHWVTTSAVIIYSAGIIYVIDKSTKTLANTYTFASIGGFDVINDTTAIGFSMTAGASVLWKFTISGTTITQGTASSAIPATNGSATGGTVAGIIGLSASQALIAINYPGAPNYGATAAVNISGAVPTFGTASNPTSSNQTSQPTTFSAWKKVSDNQAIASWTTSGSSGSNWYWLVYGSGTTVTQSVNIINSDGSTSGYGYTRDYTLPPSLNSGYSSSIFTGANGKLYFLYTPTQGSYLYLVCVKVTGNATFTVTQLDLSAGAGGNAGTWYPWSAWKIMQGGTTEDILVYTMRYANNQMRTYFYINNPTGSDTLTIKTTSNYDYMYSTFMNQYEAMPVMLLNNTLNKLAVLTYRGLSSGGSAQMQWDIADINNTTHTIGGIGDGLPARQVLPTVPLTNSVTPITTTTYPLTFNGKQYLVSSDFTIMSTDNFVTTSNVTIYKNSSYNAWYGGFSIKTIDTNLAIGRKGTKTFLIEITG